MSKRLFNNAYFITVWVDGGCRNNGTPDASGYCSVRIRGTKPEDTLFSIDLPGATTNNLAEYGALICALDILRTLQGFPRDGGYLVTIHTDSALVINQVAGTWKVKDPKFHALISEIHSRIDWLIISEILVRIEKAPRDDIVAKLGH